MFAAIIIGIFIISVIYAHSRGKKTDAVSSVVRPFDVHGPHQYVYDGVLFPARQAGFL